MVSLRYFPAHLFLVPSYDGLYHALEKERTLRKESKEKQGKEPLALHCSSDPFLFLSLIMLRNFLPACNGEWKSKGKERTMV